MAFSAWNTLEISAIRYRADSYLRMVSLGAAKVQSALAMFPNKEADIVMMWLVLIKPTLWGDYV